MLRVIAHVDLDCFFAAAETLKNPTYRYKPLIVGGRRDSLRGVVCTANYEARKYGVKSAMPISEAIRRCPKGTFISSTKGLYKTESQKVMALLRTFSPIFKQTSIDEAYLDVTHLIESTDDWISVAKHIRKSVFEKTGYTCSVGISSSRRVAKIASGYKKPHGITVVRDIAKFVYPLPIETIPGIGKKSIFRYHNAQVTRVGDLAGMNMFKIMDTFGNHAITYAKLARGEDTSQITSDGPEKSVSHETTFERDIFTRRTLEDELFRLLEKVHARTSQNYKCISLKIRFSDFTTITRSHSFSAAIHSKEVAKSAVSSLFATIDLQQPIRLVGVKLDGLESEQGQQSTLRNFIQQNSNQELPMHQEKMLVSMQK